MKIRQQILSGANFQEYTTGINTSYDIGVSENISLGLLSSYALNIESTLNNANFSDRFDIRARFNANIGNVININKKFDFYPGLSFGLKNFSGHLGARYFFSDGFGIYTELNSPLARYNTNVLTPAEKIHNTFTVNFGAVFNL